MDIPSPIAGNDDEISICVIIEKCREIVNADFSKATETIATPALEILRANIEAQVDKVTQMAEDLHQRLEKAVAELGSLRHDGETLDSKVADRQQ